MIMEEIDDTQGFSVQVGGGEVGVYSDFTVEDPGGYLNVTANRITATNLPKASVGGVYKYMGEGYFAHDFMHEFQMMITSGIENLMGSLTGYGIVNDGLTTYQAVYNPLDGSDPVGGIAVGLHPDETPKLRGFIRDCGTRVYINLDISWLQQMLYFRVTRDSVNSTCEIYSDPDRTQLLGTGVVPTSDAVYSTIQGLMFRGSPPATPEPIISGFVENLVY